jgi:hypothetical protein
MALMESHALRAFAKAGKSPQCAPMRWPWEEGYIDCFARSTAAEREAEPCGTLVAYRVHRKRNEEPCARCLAAYSRSQRERRAKA